MAQQFVRSFLTLCVSLDGEAVNVNVDRSGVVRTRFGGVEIKGLDPRATLACSKARVIAACEKADGVVWDGVSVGLDEIGAVEWTSLESFVKAGPLTAAKHTIRKYWRKAEAAALWDLMVAHYAPAKKVAKKAA